MELQDRLSEGMNCSSHEALWMVQSNKKLRFNVKQYLLSILQNIVTVIHSAALQWSIFAELFCSDLCFHSNNESSDWFLSS